MKNNLIFELLESAWSVRESSRKVLEMVANRMISDPEFNLDPIAQQIRTHAGATMTAGHPGNNPFDEFEKGSVAIIPLEGVMTRHSSWYSYGVDDIARFLHLANESASVSGVILKADTPGGSVDSVFVLQDVISRFTKPIVTLTDGALCSGGLWAAMFTDAIYALNDMNTIGSIGVMTTLTDYSGMYKDWGIVSRSIYPPESKLKNFVYREASKEKPNDQPLIEELLSPLAVKFQETVKASRPGLRVSVEGLLEGKDFFARDAVKYKLIDGIANLDQVVDIVLHEVERRDHITNI
jgi:protease-4